jgi:hypothetical protein
LAASKYVVGVMSKRNPLGIIENEFCAERMDLKIKFSKFDEIGLEIASNLLHLV